MKHDNGNMIDARERFRPSGVEYEVTIHIEVNARLLWAIAKCLLQRKDLRLTQRFKDHPF